LRQLTHRSSGPILAQPTLSPDGHTLAVDTPDQVGVLDVSALDREPPLQWLALPKDQEFFPVCWSLDGRALAGNAMQGAGSVVYNVQTRTATRYETVEVAAMPDDHTMLAIQQGNAHLVVLDLRSNALHQGDVLPDDLNEPPALTADGRFLYLNESQTVAHIWLMTEGPGAPPTKTRSTR
jgi:hypothetical protein